MTVNAVDPQIGQKIYAWVRDGKVIHRNLSGAQVLLERQLASVRGLKERGIVVKVNTIVIPGVNDLHVPEVARVMAELGVDVLNCMAMVPNADTPFAEVPEPGHGLMAEIRGQAEAHLPQMKHCQRCRADAVGLLEEDRSADFASCLEECAAHLELETEGRPYVAVASLEGVLVNQHLGEAATFQVWGPDAAGRGSGSWRSGRLPPRAAAWTGGGPWPRCSTTAGPCW